MTFDNKLIFGLVLGKQIERNLKNKNISPSKNLALKTALFSSLTDPNIGAIIALNELKKEEARFVAQAKEDRARLETDENSDEGQ